MNKNENRYKSHELSYHHIIPLEKARKPSIWLQLKNSFAKSDLSFEQWEDLETKRNRRPATLDQRARL